MAESPYAMLPVDQALEIVLAQAQTLQPETVPLPEAQGHILAQDVQAQEPLPPFPASVMDGYAVVASDGPGDYTVVGESTAGRLAEFTVEAGTVAYITTGAPIPPGADAVVMVEETAKLPDSGGQPQVRIGQRVQAGHNIRPVGVDVQTGQTVLQAGESLGPAEIGLLATVGTAQVLIYPRPKVAILSTGDELVEPDQPLELGKIRDSNRSTLHAAVMAAGGTPIDLGIGPDQQTQLEALIRQGLAQADILLTSGSVSMGDLDLLKPILEQAGQVHFGRLRMKPGKPLTFATASGDGTANRPRRLIFGLPGNPVSSLVTFYLMAVPAMHKMAGWSNPYLRQVQAQLAQPLKLDAYRPEFHRATVRWDNSLNEGNGGFLATSTGSQASSRLLSMRTANALLALPQREGELPTGSTVTALLIGDI